MTVKSVRLPDDLLEAIRFRAARERLDEATAIRQLISLGVHEYAVELYKTGKVTIREAADLAGVSVRDMLEALWQRGIRGNVTLDQQRKATEIVRSKLKEK